MIKLKDTFEEQYLKSSMDENSIYYAKISKGSKKHEISFDLSSICRPEIFDEMNGKVIPLAIIDLKEINESLSGKFHVLYHENSSIDWIVSELDDDSKIKQCYLLDSKNQINNFSDFEKSDNEFFQDGIEDTLENLITQYSESYLEIWKEKPIRPIGNLEITDSPKLSDWVQDNWAHSIQISKYDNNYFGPYILKSQSNFAIPFDSETSEDFIFIGQINSRIFNLCDFSYFLFYNKKNKVIAQLMQMT